MKNLVVRVTDEDGDVFTRNVKLPNSFTVEQATVYARGLLFTEGFNPLFFSDVGFNNRRLKVRATLVKEKK